MSDYQAKIQIGMRDWFMAIGEFVNAFEHLCAHVRLFIYRDCGTHNYESQQKIMTLLTPLGASDLADTVERLFRRTGRLPTGDEKRKVFRDFKALCETRNNIVHIPWFIGSPQQESTPDAEKYDPYTVTGFNLARRLSVENAYDVPTLKIGDVRAATIEAKRLHNAFNELMAGLLADAQT